MDKLFSSVRRFLSELRRRKVYRVAVTYVIVGFFVIEGADLVLTRLGLPGWTVTFVIVLVGVGFPIALVLAWALEMTPEGVRVEETAREEPEISGEDVRVPTTTRDLWVGAFILALLLLGAWWGWGNVGGGRATDQAGSRASETQERSIAVLPFEVSGSGAEEWQDGMVTMLSMSLDGAAGLRAIPDRTVFAAWERRDSTKAGASAREALTVARNVDAEYAIDGSAVKLGEELRLGVEVRKVQSGGHLGQVEVRGSPDRVPALTDRLTRKVLGVLLEKSEDRIPSVNLASVTTESLQALKDFLEGERHFRAGDYETAIDDYEAAIQKDSSFALAYERLASAREWLGGFAEGSPALQRAYELSGRLPERERRLVRAKYLWSYQIRRLAAADSLRQLSEAYPDDPSVWFHLGEVLYHGHTPRGLPEADEAFERAAELDPGFAQYHHHLVELAFSLHHDSTLATERIRAHPEGAHKQTYQLALDLVFGSPEHRKEALARVDDVPRSTAAQLLSALNHPTDGDLKETVLHRLLKREDIEESSYAHSLFLNSLGRGQVEKALTQLQTYQLNTPNSDCYLAAEMVLGTPLPDSLLRARLEPSQVEEGASLLGLTCPGHYLIERNRSEELPALIRRMRKAGNLKRAAQLWSRANYARLWGPIWRGDLYRKLGQLEKAEGWYLAAWTHPVAHERLGRLYEEMGKPEKAIAAYRRFIQAWKNVDPKLQDRVEKARRRLRALSEKGAAG